MQWVRIDNRLVHGQIIETWLPHTRAGAIFVANDKVAEDAIQQEIMALAIPQSIQFSCTRILDVAQTMRSLSVSAIVLFATCADAMKAYENDFSFDVLNVGNIHYGQGKRQLSASVALSIEEEELLRRFALSGVRLDFRCVPNDPVQVKF
ncbi:MAG: PTS sugar transporter subunit IIB [Proteobacteria bacterium]|nr:PTS sugar transporter subunit IIB [Pseudomonadota bacterium]MBU1612088.1 PTS sugar transporter subunit IIB [Pseudomonadota bacterium]